jgi:hypothetical protein
MKLIFPWTESIIISLPHFLLFCYFFPVVRLSAATFATSPPPAAHNKQKLSLLRLRGCQKALRTKFALKIAGFCFAPPTNQQQQQYATNTSPKRTLALIPRLLTQTYQFLQTFNPALESVK